MRNVFVALLMLLCSTTSALAGVSVSIGLNVPVYPQLVPVPGYPVYYAPGLNSNYFFYDGMYWVFIDDNWYASTWYNGPWEIVAPDFVPLFILRVPVRYYRQPPYYFHTWYANAPPRWGEHWGGTWEQHHRGWNNWNRAAVPAPAPLPVYQRQYSGTRYPAVEQQYALQTQNYRYRPRDTVVQQQYQASTQVRSATAQQSTVTAPLQPAPTPTQRREAERRTTAPSQQAAMPPSRGRSAQTERAEVSRAPPAAAPAPQAALPQQRAQQSQVDRAARPMNASPQAALSPPRAPPSQVERAARPTSPPPQAAVSPPRGQPPQHAERIEPPQRTASAPMAQPQRQASPPRGPQGHGSPPSREQNQEREGGQRGGGDR